MGTFQASTLHQYAIAKALENIGEAARKVSNATKEAHPEIPWSAIVALRHRIAHDYFSLDLLRIWSGILFRTTCLRSLKHWNP